MQTINTRLSLSVYDATSRGVKSTNDDHVSYYVPQDNLLGSKGASFAVADGVGSAARGKEAAITATQSFISEYYSAPVQWGVAKCAEVVIDGINKWLYEQSQLHGMACETGYVCTLSSMILLGNQAHLFHIGDSRIYRWRNGVLDQLTRDHVSDLRSGSSYLSKAMGLCMRTDVDYSTLDFRVGDVFVLATDGLYNFVTESLLAESCEAPSLQKTGKALIEKALSNGSKDNLSLIMVRVNNV